jgi:hypothetical protein
MLLISSLPTRPLEKLLMLLLAHLLAALFHHRTHVLPPFGRFAETNLIHYTIQRKFYEKLQPPVFCLYIGLFLDIANSTSMNYPGLAIKCVRIEPASSTRWFSPRGSGWSSLPLFP